jgi:membrane protease YdiL (CAAX protease family)
MMAEDHRIHQRSTPPVPWTGVEIVGVVLFGIVWPMLLYYFLRYSGWYGWFYGSDFLDKFDLVQTDVVPDWLGWFCGLDFPEELRQAQNRARQVTQTRLMLWAFCAALPFQLASTLALLNAFSGTRPVDVGLTSARLGRNLLSGLVAALAVVPGVYGIQGLVLYFVKQLGGSGQEHPFAKLGETSLLPAEWVVLILSATIIAPVWEELLFRGIIQPWVSDRRYGGAAAFLAALAVTLSARMDYIKEAIGLSDLLMQLLPIIVLVALVPVYLLLVRRSRLAGGLFAASVLFAWIHAGVWPSPIPLLWLALALGWLAQRTHSLAGPILMHALFNGVACLLLLIQLLIP